MKNLICITILLISGSISAQKYYPKLNNLFLETVAEESLFGIELNYFREGVRAATNKVFYGNLQTSNGRNAAFYSMKVIPRFVTEFNILESGMVLKFNATSKEEHPSFPLYANELMDTDDEEKAIGFGDINIGNNGLILKFNNNLITAFDIKEKRAIESLFAEFTIDKIDYKIRQSTSLILEVQGKFNTDIKIKKNKYAKEAVSLLTITVTKEAFSVSFVDPVSNKIITIVNQSAPLVKN